ncbi:hypothetical protein [Dokdonia sp. R78006]|uniref:hypothetical protein n=1 Tax=Dokdonia sp. R78006 TaxID=3093866 RepID=UPI0036D38B16
MKKHLDHSNENDYKIILSLIKGFLKTKRFIIISVTVFLILGVIVVLSKPKTYSSSVLFITQDSSSAQSSGLGGIASLISGGTIKSSSTNDIPTFLYPQIIDSWEFRKQLFDTPLKLKNEDSLITLRRYVLEREGTPIMQTVAKYTVGLPGLISGKNEVKSISSDRIDSLEYITNDDRRVLESLQEKVSFAISKDDGTLEIRTAIREEPIAAAQLAKQVQLKLQKEIIRYRIGKAQEKYDFIENQYQETKQKYKDSQISLARYSDRNRFNTTESSLIRKRELESESTLLYALYSDLEQQRITQSIKIKEDTPNFTIINPAVVPSRADGNNSIITLFIYGIVGFIVAVFRYLFIVSRSYVSSLWKEV